MEKDQLDVGHENPSGAQPKGTVQRLIGVVAAAAGLAAVLSCMSNVLVNENASNNIRNHLASFNWVPPPGVVYEFGVGQPKPVDAPEVLDRIPSKGSKFTIDIFSHPKIQAAIANSKNSLVDVACSGPRNNIDMWLDEEAVRADLVNDESYLAFGLDCRIPGEDLLAFLVVLSSKGHIVNAVELKRRTESLIFKNTTTLVAAAGGGGGAPGVMIWNFVDDIIQPAGFQADTHSLVYRDSENMYYGFYPDKMARELHRPNTVSQFHGDTGATALDTGKGMWYWQNPGTSHFNWVSVAGDAAYVSAAGAACLKKLNMRTNQIEWTLGGTDNTFEYTDFYGNKMGPGSIHDWNGQHKFQHLDDQYVSLFDNNVGRKDQQFVERPWGKSSRMVVVKIDQQKQTAEAVFSYPVGDRARSYGGTDILPSGNLLGSSYVDWVFPALEDYQYHQNIWEVSPDGDVVWRVGFKGVNPMAPSNLVDPYPHHFGADGANHDIMPSGWNVYVAERSYPSPVVNKPCLLSSSSSSSGQQIIQFIPFNTVRSQEDYPGVAYLVNTATKQQLASQNFYFHKSWLPRPVSIPLSGAMEKTPLSLVVSNHWGDVTTVDLGLATSLEACTEEDPYRRFYPLH